MKVLILPSWYPNKKQDSGSFFKEQAALLSKNGFDVKVLMAEELHTKSYIYQRLKRIIKLKSNKLSTDYLAQQPDAYSFPVILQKSWSDKKQINVANKKYLKAYKTIISTGWIPNIIHVQGTYKAGFSAQFISEKYNVPYVVIEHSPFKLAAYSKFREAKIRNVLQKAKKVAGVSNFQRKQMLSQGISRDIDVIWNLTDERKFTLKNAKKINKNSFVITTITRPIKIKDVDTFFESVSTFISKISDRNKIEIMIVGHAGLNNANANTDYFDKKAAALGLSSICTFMPILSRDEVLKLLNKTDVFISTSLYESFGVAIREAMLSGVPVIATKSGGPQDTVNNKTGVLVEKGDVEAISKNLYDIYKGRITFDSEYIRNYVISQSGRKAFLKAMSIFYNSMDNEF